MPDELSPCPANKISFAHGPITKSGKCPWCNQPMGERDKEEPVEELLDIKIDSRLEAERRPKPGWLSDVEACPYCGEGPEACECE